MASTNHFLTGKVALLGLIRDDSISGEGILPVISATINTRIDTPDASNFASSGFTTLVPGIRAAEITVEIAYDKVALPPIFAGMKASVTLEPTGNLATFTGLPPTNTEASLAANEYLAYDGTPPSFIFDNCTVTNVVYDVPVRDIQKVRLTLVPSADNTGGTWDTVKF